MPEQEDERTAAICRQAALPMLRQRHLAIVPGPGATWDAPAGDEEPAPPSAPIGSATGPPDRGFGAFFRLDRPR